MLQQTYNYCGVNYNIVNVAVASWISVKIFAELEISWLKKTISIQS